MYREKLMHYSKSNEYVHPREGADIKAIEEAEKNIQCIFPNELRELLLETDGDGYLFFSVEEIVKTVGDVRAAMAECYEGVKFLLFFAGNGCGDYYCYKIMPSGEVNASAVYIWMHEDNELKFAAHNLSELIDRYFNDEI